VNKLNLVGGILALNLAIAASAQATGFVDFKVGANADQKNIIQQGVYMADLSGSITTVRSNTQTDVQGQIGTFFSSNIEGWIGVGFSAAGSANSWDVSGGVRYYVDPSQDKTMLPFVGVFAMYDSPNGGTKTTGYGAEVGVDFFVSPNVSFTPRLFWDQITGSGISTSEWGLNFGLTFWFNSK
jgi:hypothetical protein